MEFYSYCWCIWVHEGEIVKRYDLCPIAHTHTHTLNVLPLTHSYIFELLCKTSNSQGYGPSATRKRQRNSDEKERKKNVSCEWVSVCVCVLSNYIPKHMSVIVPKSTNVLPTLPWCEFDLRIFAIWFAILNFMLFHRYDHFLSLFRSVSLSFQ